MNDKNVQKCLNKLISEEMIANLTYIGCVNAVKAAQRDEICEMFYDIAKDELDDHHKNLVKWALENDYEVPFTLKDFEKYAQDDVKMLNALKTGKDAKEYIKTMIESEKSAMQSYNEALNDESIPYELHTLLTNNFFDEVEHLNNLMTMSYALDADVSISI